MKLVTKSQYNKGSPIDVGVREDTGSAWEEATQSDAEYSAHACSKPGIRLDRGQRTKRNGFFRPQIECGDWRKIRASGGDMST